MPRRKKADSLKEILQFAQFLENVSTKIHGVLGEQNIYKVIKREFKKSKKYSITIFHLAEDGSQLGVAETSLSPTRKAKAGKASRVRLKGYAVDIKQSGNFKKVIRKGKTERIGLVEMMDELVPGVRLYHLPKGKHVVVTPLRKHRKTIGAIAISTSAVSKESMSSVKTFSRHISAALELADQYTDRKRVEDELRSSREQLRNLSGYLQSVREEERGQIAREIHDELGQTITALKLDLLGLKDELSKKQKRLAEKAGSIVSLTDRSLQTVHKICGELRPKFLDDLGLAAAIEWQAEEFQKRTGIECVVTVEPQDMSVDSDLSITLFRVFQEALTNVARHAGAAKVEASLRRIDGKVLLEVKDDGRGITKGQVSHPKSFGLVGMRERIRAHGGELKIRGRRGKGTDLTVAVPLEEAPLRPMVTRRMVGRDQEMRRLRRLFRNVEKKEGKLVLVHGEAGIGKTRLVTEFAQDLETRGVTVLIGACREDIRAIPYYPFREALNRFIDTRKAEATRVFSELPDYAKWELSRLLPDVRTPGLTEFEPAKDQFRLFESFRLFIQGIAGQSNKPLFFAVEDLHVSDDASLDLLHYLARNLSKSGVQLCATYRTEETQENVHKLTGLLQKERLSANVALGPLSSDDISEIINLLHPGSKAPRKLSEMLYERSEGNPLFVQEMTKLLTAVDVKEGVPKEKKVPKAIKSVLQRRIELLDPGAREILSCGALVGEEFEFEVLQTALGRVPMEVMEAVEAGTRAYVVRESPSAREERYRFTHSLMADVLYSGIGKVRRKLWHSKVGDALEQHYADRLSVLNGRLTHHFELAENWEKAFTYALASAKDAMETYANEDGLSNCRRALHVSSKMTSEAKKRHEQEVIDLHLIMGRCLHRICKIRDAIDSYRRALHASKQQKSATQEIQALMNLIHLELETGMHSTAQALAERSLEINTSRGDKKGVADSLIELARVCSAKGMIQEALKHLERCLEISKSLTDIGLKVRGLRQIGELHSIRGDHGQALVYLEEALGILRASGKDEHRLLTARLLESMGRVQGRRRSIREAKKHTQDALALYRRMGDQNSIVYCLSTLGIISYYELAWERALGYHEQALRIYRASALKPGIAATLHNIGLVHSKISKPREALKFFLEALDVQKETGHAEFTANHLLSIARCYLGMASYSEALEHADKALAIYEKMGSKPAISGALSYKSECYREMNDLETATELAKQSVTLAEEVGDTNCVLGSMVNLSACLRAQQRFADSLCVTKKALTLASSPAYESDVRTEIAAAYLDMGHRNRASTMIDRVLASRRKPRLNSALLGRAWRVKCRCLQAGGLSAFALKYLEWAEEKGSPQDILAAHAAIGRGLRERCDLMGARKHYRAAKETAQGIASRIRSTRMRQSYMNRPDIREVFAEMAELEGKKPPKAKS